MAKLKSSAKSKTKQDGKRAAAADSSEGLQHKAEHVSRSIMDSAHQIWMAGMGAFARAQQEGSKMFESLVSEGMTIEKRTRKAASGHVDAVRDAVESRVGQAKERASDTWDRLETVFEDRVQRTLTRLGVPSRDDLKALIARVDELNAELRKLSGKPAAADTASKPARKAPARKSSAAKAAKTAASDTIQPETGSTRAARKAPPIPTVAAASSAPAVDE